MLKNLTINQVAEEVGLRAKTIRYYESIGVIKPSDRASNGYRIFSERDIQRLKLIKRARDLGLSIDEIRNIVSECIDKGCDSARSHVAKRMPGYIQEIDNKVQELNKLKQDLLNLQDQYNNKKVWEHSTDKCCEIIPLERQI